MRSSAKTFSHSTARPYSRPYPIRLRLRFPQLRRAPLACAQFAASVRRIAGIDAVEASAVTGSVLVSYRLGNEDEQAVLAALRDTCVQHGLSCDSPRGAAQRAGAPAPSVGAAVADRFVGSVVDKLVERSALALVAALL